MHASPGTPSLDVPDHLTLPQFFSDFHHHTRPKQARWDEAYLIDEPSGNKSSFNDLHARSLLLANAIGLKWGIGNGDVVAVLAPNHIDVPVIIWAVHRLGGIITTADPVFSTTQDLINQLKSTNTTLVIVHPDLLDKIDSVAERADIPLHRILLLEAPKRSGVSLYPVLSTIIADFDDGDSHFVERTLSPGEGKTTTAFYFFSNGLSGFPKVTLFLHSERRVSVTPYYGTAAGNKPLCDHRQRRPTGRTFPNLQRISSCRCPEIYTR